MARFHAAKTYDTDRRGEQAVGISGKEHCY